VVAVEADQEESMSDALGAVRFPDGLVLFFLYHGTSDTCDPALWENPENRWDEMRGAWDKVDACRHSEPITIYSDYGGHYWPGKGCRTCMVITEGGVPFPDDWSPAPVEGPELSDGTPEWFIAARNEWAKKNGFQGDTP
jgi:hypothetical protein